MALDAPYAATLGLSATPERNHDDGIERYVVPALGPVIYEYVQDEAITDGVIAPAHHHRHQHRRHRC